MNNDKQLSFAELIGENAQMKADIRTTVKVISNLIDAFGIDRKIFEGGVSDLQSVLPTLVGKLTMQLSLGTFDSQSLANLSALAPIIERYKYLVELEIAQHGSTTGNTEAR
jgi:hypothetical protein